MKRYNLHQDPTSRYAKMQENEKGEFVKYSDMVELFSEAIEAHYMEKTHDLLVKHGVIKE